MFTDEPISISLQEATERTEPGISLSVPSVTSCENPNQQITFVLFVKSVVKNRPPQFAVS